MKKKLVAMIASIFLLTSCGSNSSDGINYSNNASKYEESCKDLATGSDEKTSGEYKSDSNDYSYSSINTENYKEIIDNRYKAVSEEPLSTFSLDVDTASYSNIRRYLMHGQLPPADAVRIEEMVNYFPYNYKKAIGKEPFHIGSQIAVCPWNEKHYLARLALNAKSIIKEERPASNLVFLFDVSGSMNDSNKLPLLKSSFKMLVRELDEDDRVAIVVYAGAAGLVLKSTSGYNDEKILEAIENLQAGGSTAGGEGINLAYKIAEENFIENGNNRIILATDGDFNVGPSSGNDLTELIEERRESGIFLSVLGFGEGNLNDATAELLADKGNGNYAYIDTLLEAKKVLVDQIGSTLYTVAKDVKYQVEFNPGKVKGYRLIGYENRMLNNEDFEDDSKDAGDIGSGHTVTAFYELILADSEESIPGIELKYQNKEIVKSDEWYTLKVRYKTPKGSESQLIEIPVKITEETEADDEFYFASSVAELGLLLRDSEYKGDASYTALIKRAKITKGKDPNGYRSEFIKLAELAKKMND